MKEEKLKSLENIVTTKMQELIENDPELQVSHKPYDITWGSGAFEGTLCKRNAYDEMTEKVIVSTITTGPDTAELHVNRLWDWRSGGYWDKQKETYDVVNY